MGWSGMMRKILPPTGIRLPDPLARSESLYRLHYPGLHMTPCDVLNVENALTNRVLLHSVRV